MRCILLYVQIFPPALSSVCVSSQKEELFSITVKTRSTRERKPLRGTSEANCRARSKAGSLRGGCRIRHIVKRRNGLGVSKSFSSSSRGEQKGIHFRIWCDKCDDLGFAGHWLCSRMSVKSRGACHGKLPIMTCRAQPLSWAPPRRLLYIFSSPSLRLSLVATLIKPPLLHPWLLPPSRDPLAF